MCALYSLIGRKSTLSTANKLMIYQSGPSLTYASLIWHTSAKPYTIVDVAKYIPENNFQTSLETSNDRSTWTVQNTNNCWIRVQTERQIQREMHDFELLFNSWTVQSIIQYSKIICTINSFDQHHKFPTKMSWFAADETEIIETSDTTGNINSDNAKHTRWNSTFDHRNSETCWICLRCELRTCETH